MNSFAREILDGIDQETRAEINKHADIVMHIKSVMKSKGLNQKGLADLLGKRPSEISKLMSLDHNMTLKTLTKLELALEEHILIIPTKRFSKYEEHSASKKSKEFNTDVQKKEATVYDITFRKYRPQLKKAL